MSSELVIHRSLDEVEAIIVACGGVLRVKGETVPELPLCHRFTLGMYIRELRMPAGTFLTTHVHKTEHPYVVSQGVASVYSDADGPVLICAPHSGITQKGTRRFIVVHEDMIWTTFHATSETSIEALEDELFEPIANPLLEAALLTREHLRVGAP